jgi:hypothetical protein
VQEYAGKEENARINTLAFKSQVLIADCGEVKKKDKKKDK